MTYLFASRKYSWKRFLSLLLGVYDFWILFLLSQIFLSFSLFWFEETSLVACLKRSQYFRCTCAKISTRGGGFSFSFGKLIFKDSTWSLINYLSSSAWNCCLFM